MPPRLYIDAIHDALDEAMAADPRVIIMGEDIEAGGVFRATEGLLDKYGAGRVLDTPLAESGIVGIAIGAAMNGMRPVAEIQFADFIFPAMNQIISEAARISYRSHGGFNCPIVLRVPYGGGIHGALYHSQSVEAFFAHVPGLKVVAPSTPADAAGLLRAAIDDDNPVLYLEHKRAYRLISDELSDRHPKIEIGTVAIPREGNDLTVFTYGYMVHETLKAADRLSQEQGTECCVVDLRTLAPLDKPTILETARKTGKVLIVHEDNLTGGFGAEIAAIIAEEAFEAMDAPIMRLAAPDVPSFPFAESLESVCLPDSNKIYEALCRLAAY